MKGNVLGNVIDKRISRLSAIPAINTLRRRILTVYIQISYNIRITTSNKPTTSFTAFNGSMGNVLGNV